MEPKLTSPKYLFIAGAPKCATGALFDYLGRSSEVEASFPKETFYFLDKEHPLLNAKKNVWQNGLEGFHNFFKDSSALRLEATTHLMYQDEAINKIKALGSVRFVLVLRDPALRLYSSFQYTRNNLSRFRKDLSFTNFVDLLLGGRESELADYLENGASRYVLSRDLTYGRYHTYLENLWTCVGPQNCYVLTLESIKQDSATQLRQLTDWIGLEPEEQLRGSLEHHNTTVRVKNKWLHRSTRQLGRLLPAVEIKKKIKRFYEKVQYGSKPKRSKMDEESIARLREYYAPYNSLLAAKTGLDLSEWR